MTEIMSARKLCHFISISYREERQVLQQRVVKQRVSGVSENSLESHQISIMRNNFTAKLPGSGLVHEKSFLSMVPMDSR